MHVNAIGATLRIHVDDPSLLGRQIIDIESRREDDAPVLRTKAGVAAEKLGCKTEELRHKELAGAPEEFLATGTAGRNQARSRQLAAIDRGYRLRCEVE